LIVFAFAGDSTTTNFMNFRFFFAFRQTFRVTRGKPQNRENG
jgi:hypothetical protein